MILKLIMNSWIGATVLVEAFVVSNNIDIFCILEMFLDSSVVDICDKINVIDSTLVRIDDPYTKCIGVAIYY